MSSRNLRRHRVPLIALIALIFFSDRLNAQQSGHYLQGITGLDNGTAPPPGIYLTYAAWVNTALSFQGPQGNTLEDLGLNIGAHNIVIQVTTRKKFLGAYYGFSSIVSIVNSRVVTAVPNPTSLHAGLSDVYISPGRAWMGQRQGELPAQLWFLCSDGTLRSIKIAKPWAGFLGTPNPGRHQLLIRQAQTVERLCVIDLGAQPKQKRARSEAGSDAQCGVRPGASIR